MGNWSSLTNREFLNELAGDERFPAGVSVAAIAGAYAAALGIKAASQTYGSASWDLVEPGIQGNFRNAHEEIEVLRTTLLRQMDADDAENDVVRALTIPLTCAEQCLSVLENLQEIATCGVRSALADVGAASAMALAGVDAALLNVRERLSVIPDEKQRQDWFEQAERMWERGAEIKEETMAALFIRMSVEEK